MKFQQVTLEHVSIAGPKSEHEEAVDWCITNGFVIKKAFCGAKRIGFQITAVRLASGGGRKQWKATAKQLRG